MRRVIAAAALLAAAFFGYRYYDTSYAPEKKYKEFAEEMLKRLMRLVQVASNPRLVDDSYRAVPGKFPILLNLVHQAVDAARRRATRGPLTRCFHHPARRTRHHALCH